MKHTTKNKIIAYISKKNTVSPKDLENYLSISRQMLHRHLRDLQKEKKIIKRGAAPKVFYSLASDQERHLLRYQDDSIKEKIDAYYLSISPDGKKYNGSSGFAAWCARHQFDLDKTAHDYVQTLEHYQQYQKDGLINGLPKMQQSFEQVALDEMYYLDFYSLPRFGKTKLGSLLLYAKQSQNQTLIQELIEIIEPHITQLTENKSIDAIGFIPPTVLRQTQIQKEFSRALAQTLPRIPIVKVHNDIPVPQKTLRKLADRIENAHASIVVEDFPAYKHILLIDDAVGSGATLNETAKKIKARRPDTNVIGLAITGSLNGFDVLNEV